MLSSRRGTDDVSLPVFVILTIHCSGKGSITGFVMEFQLYREVG